MATRPSALGRGLDALIPDAPPQPSTTGESASGSAAVREIPVDSVDPNPEQPRRRFDDAALGQLARSLQRHGVLQPVVVREAGDRYELVVGERRWRAARQAGLDHIPAVVADVAPQERLEIALVENVQRDDLNPIELALAFRTLTESGATQEEVGARVGLDRSSVANHIRLLELPRAMQEDVEEARIAMGHAKALLQVANPERRHHLRDRIVQEGLSVRAVEELARASTPATRRKRRSRRADAHDPDTEALLDRLRDRLQTSVKIVGTPARGRVEIHYFGPEDLNRVTGILLGE